MKWWNDKSQRQSKLLLKSSHRKKNHQHQEWRIKRLCVRIIILLLLLLLLLLLVLSAVINLVDPSLLDSSSSRLFEARSFHLSKQHAQHSDHHDARASSSPPRSASPPPIIYNDELPKELEYIPNDRLQEKDYFSGAFLVSRQTFLQKLHPKHYIKLESASLEASRAAKQQAKMTMDYTCLAVEHFSHWWKTLYNIVEYSYNTTVNCHDDSEDHNDNDDDARRMLRNEQTSIMNAIVEIWKRYLHVTAPRQLKWNWEYHHHEQEQQDQEQEQHPMQRTIAAIAFQPYRLPSSCSSSFSSSSAQQEQYAQQQLLHIKQLEQTLTIHSLAATISSMVAAGFGRILVVGYHNHQQKQHQLPSVVKRAFAMVQDAFSSSPNVVVVEGHHRRNESENSNNNHNLNTTKMTTTTTSLGYVAITDETWVRNYRRKKLFNLQRGVVTGLQMAFENHEGYNNNNMKHHHHHHFTNKQQQEWLGPFHHHHDDDNKNKDDYWKYVFLTEPDLLLHTKPYALSLMQKGMDEQGFSYFPHRLQPLPHQGDFKSLLLTMDDHEDNDDDTVGDVTIGDGDNKQSLLHSHLLPDDIAPFSNITTMLYPYDSCCDDDDEEYSYPGRTVEFGWRQHQVPCEDWWWTCGYLHNHNKVPKDSIEWTNNDNATNATTDNGSSNKHASFLRLARYPMLRLQGGSGVVFGSTEQGRRCIPRKGPSCG